MMFSPEVNDIVIISAFNLYIIIIIHILGEVGRKRCVGNETLGANPSILDVDDYPPSEKGINYYN